MSPSDDGENTGLRTVFATFGGPPRTVHALVVLGGCALWIGTYIGVMELTGWTTIVAEPGPDAVAARRNAAAVATGLTGAYYGFAWVYSYGGPLLNFVVPVAFVAFMPDQVYVLFQPTTADVMVSAGEPMAGTRLLNPTFVIDMLVVWVPGVIGLLGSILLWYRYRWTDAHWERFRRRLPDEWSGED